MDDVNYVIHERSRHSNGARSLTHSLTHSILINLFIKVGLNLFSPTSPAKYCFASRTSRHMFDWFYGGGGGTRKA